ncbi:hypothetical protein MmiAt1_17770 [Methanimicrococcus sp. At1]|uniref:Uncharacterized protein n=1 Tax=Methanimicrococcus hacksteinii TaxID=3028293 RepID=A0ABU3VRW4_9EURY|nr:hypothetical protein [Methanimicrococcus sp. At1]MDV0446159.1 hypothetical protein [Methanimicrococcus sp. At1]
MRSDIFRTISTCLIIGVLFILAAAIPAAAADYEVRGSWIDNNNAATQIFRPNDTNVLSYTINANNIELPAYFILSIADNGGEPLSGFDIFKGSR